MVGLPTLEVRDPFLSGCLLCSRRSDQLGTLQTIHRRAVSGWAWWLKGEGFRPFPPSLLGAGRILDVWPSVLAPDAGRGPVAGVCQVARPGLANCLPPLHGCGDFASQRGVAGRSRMPSARAERGRSSFPPPGCGRHPPGCGPVRCLCVSKLHAERFLVAFAAEAALATLNPGLCPSRRGGGWPTPDRVVQRRVVGCSPERLCVPRLGGWGWWTGLGRPPRPRGSLPTHSVRLFRLNKEKFSCSFSLG